MLEIIADDLGLTESVNDGIIFLLKAGKINGVSLMANGEAFDNAITQCLEVEPLNIGAHLVLVEEKSISGIKLPSNHKIFFIKYVLGLIKLPDIGKELKTQLDKIIGSGIKPSFINSHQHLHLLPGIMDIIVKIAREYQIPYIRIVNEPASLSGGKLFRKLQLLFLNFLSKLAKRKIRKAGLQCNDFFVGFVNAGNLDSSDVKFAENLATEYSDKIIELGCHPGYNNGELENKYKKWGSYNWEKELELLKNHRSSVVFSALNE